VTIDIRRPQSPWQWLALLPAIAIGLVMMLFGLALALLFLLAAPIIAWWQRRKGGPRAPRPPAGRPRVIDVDDYDVRDV
jgi:uncharacterized protein (DUF58 family)